MVPDLPAILSRPGRPLVAYEYEDHARRAAQNVRGTEATKPLDRFARVAHPSKGSKARQGRANMEPTYSTRTGLPVFLALE